MFLGLVQISETILQIRPLGSSLTPYLCVLIYYIHYSQTFQLLQRDRTLLSAVDKYKKLKLLCCCLAGCGTPLLVNTVKNRRRNCLRYIAERRRGLHSLNILYGLLGHLCDCTGVDHLVLCEETGAGTN